MAQAATVAERERQFKCMNAATTMPIVSYFGLKNARSAERDTVRDSRDACSPTRTGDARMTIARWTCLSFLRLCTGI